MATMNRAVEDTQTQVLKILQASKSGLQMEEVGEKLGLARDRVAKYADELRGKWLRKEARKDEYRT